MIEIVLTGKREVGKTLFMLQFAEYIAEENGFDCLYQSEQGVHLKKVSDRIKAWDIYHKGVQKQYLPQSICLFDKAQKKHFKFTDTYGLTDGISYHKEERRKIKHTLETVIQSRHLIHMIDYKQIEKRGLDPIDQELYQLGKNKHFYLMVLNKSDMDASMAKFTDFQKRLKIPMLPVSSMYKEGFFHIYQQIRTIVREPALSR